MASRDPWAEDERFEGTLDRSLLRWMLGYAKPQRRALASCLMLLLLLTALEMAQPYLVRQAIDNVFRPAAALPLGAARRAHLDQLWPFVALYLFTVAAAGILEYIQLFWLRVTGVRIITAIRRDVFTHLQTLSLKFYDTNPTGRLVTRVTNDVEALAEMYTNVLVNLFRDVFVVVGAFLVLLSMDATLAMVSLAVLPLVAVTSLVFRHHARRAWRQVRARLARINARLAEDFSGMRTIQIFGREDESAREFAEINNAHFRAILYFLRINATFAPVLDLLTSLTIALIVYNGGGRVLQGTVTLGTLYAFTAYVRRMFEPLNALADKFNTLQAAMASAERLTQLVATEPEVVDPARPLRLSDAWPIAADGHGQLDATSVKDRGGRADGHAATRRPDRVDGHRPRGRPGQADAAVEFDDVWFAYKPDEWVLRGVTFKVAAGQTVAFVGRTGAGKSTIMNLLPRFYDVQRGAVRVHGLDVRELGQDELRRHVGTVMQDVFLFAGDVAWNISLGDARLPRETLVRAAEIVGADPFIRRLPAGYEEPVVERGLSLSAGQRQLISFARAMAYDPEILILDEATASIDTETEEALQRAMKAVSTGRTTIVVAHRLSTIQDADRIYVMDAGQIVEEGSHDELLALGGRYFRLWQLQFEEGR